ncbi:hypothetical protein L1987_12357 [Smallanthus sonchifolius]|uniref:Uncharacterized protein n=1 Tax=Smallanthus sonchifolius TaxID=185202 RepID=A0ACB9JH06_9ASTR|nr:hypothetical protein L1987_12357 [Smallanthus sonchifolius]
MAALNNGGCILMAAATRRPPALCPTMIEDPFSQGLDVRSATAGYGTDGGGGDFLMMALVFDGKGVWSGGW